MDPLWKLQLFVHGDGSGCFGFGVVRRWVAGSGLKLLSSSGLGLSGVRDSDLVFVMDGVLLSVRDAGVEIVVSMAAGHTLLKRRLTLKWLFFVSYLWLREIRMGRVGGCWAGFDFVLCGLG